MTWSKILSNNISHFVTGSQPQPPTGHHPPHSHFDHHNNNDNNQDGDSDGDDNGNLSGVFLLVNIIL
jgi:hypothetical protein